MPNGRVPSVTLTCEKCGQQFHPWKKDRPSRYCSRECSGGWGRSGVAPDAKCETCGVLFRPTNKHNASRFCSRDCYRNGPKKYTKGKYLYVYRPDHPNAYASGQIAEHRVVMEEKLGRLLLPSETVHHVNGDTHDNRPENLQVRQGRHGRGSVHQCLDCGSHNIGAVPLPDKESHG